MATNFEQNINVSGTVNATSFTGDGSSLTGVSGSDLTIQDEGSALSTAATTLNFVGAGVTASGTGATKTITISGGGGGGGISNIVEDTSPQLGGTLDANGNTIDMGTNILTDTNLGQFITAHGWGDHASAGYLTSGGAFTLPTSIGTSGQVLKVPSSGTLLEWADDTGGGGGGGISNLSEDTTPQLGGDLDVNGKNISFGDSASATDDRLVFGANTDMQIYHDSSDGYNYIKQTAQRLYFQNDDDGLHGPYIIFDHNTTSPSIVDFSSVLAFTSRDTSGGLQQTGQITFMHPEVNANSLKGMMKINIADSAGLSEYFTLDGVNARIDLKKAVRFSDAFTMPTSDGSANQVLQTNGAGVVSWATVTGGGGGTLASLTDVDTTGVANDKILKYNSTSSKWVIADDATSGGGALGDLSVSGSTMSSSGTTITLDDNVTVTGTLTSSQAGAPILTSASTLTLQATTRTTIANTPLKLHSFTTTARDALSAADGDMIYNSTTNKFQGFANGSWVDLH